MGNDDPEVLATLSKLVSLSVMESAVRLIREIPLEGLRAPRELRPEGAESLGVADLYLRQFHTYIILLQVRHAELLQEQGHLEECLPSHAGLSVWSKEVSRGFERLKTVRSDISYAERLEALLQGFFWLEAEFRNSKLNLNPRPVLCSDWHFVSRDQFERRGAMFRFRIGELAPRRELPN